MTSRTLFAQLTLITLGTLALTQPTPSTAAQGHGTDILHYAARAPFVADAAVPNASGNMYATRKEQGHVAAQNLDILVKGLPASSPFKCVALLKDDPTATPVALADFSSSSKGTAVLKFRNMQFGNGKSSAVHGGRMPLPSTVDPVTKIAKVLVTDTNGVTLLTAALSTPPAFSYLVKRSLSSGSVQGLLLISANTSRATLAFSGRGFSSDAIYTPFLNGVAGDPFTSTSAGRLSLSVAFDNAADALQLQTFEVKDSLPATVLSTTLP